jgi:methionyl-tRNA formyltransferase
MTRAVPRLRVAFLGNADRSVPSLEAAAGAHHELVFVGTRDARPAGRGHRLRRTPVAEAADRFGLGSLVVETPTVRRGDGLDRLRASAPDVLAVVAYGEILPTEVLRIAARMPINVHFSLLPRWRGAAPVERAILAGDETTGVTIMRMTEGLDEGPILAQCEIGVGDADAGTLGAMLAVEGAALLVTTLDRLATGTVLERPQDAAVATFAPKLRPEERAIDWSRAADVVLRTVRAFAPAPGAVTTFRGKRMKVLRASLAEPSESFGAARDPGGFVGVNASGEGPIVRTGTGAIRLDEVVPEARGRMSGVAFVHGFAPEVGEILG